MFFRTPLEVQSPSRSRRSAHRHPSPNRGRLLAVCYGWGVLVGATLTYLALAPITPAASSGQSIALATANLPNSAESSNSAVAALTPSALSAPSAPLTPPIGNGSQVTVCVKEYFPEFGDLCSGSAVSIDPNLIGIDAAKGAVLITNFHVIVPLDSFRVQLRGEGKIFQAQWIAQSPDQDLAILFVPDASFPVIPLADASPPPGTAIRAAGFPEGNPLTVRDSTLLGTTNICLAIPPCLAMRQGTISHGDSGGSLEANGQLIGINEGELQDEFAIQIERVHQFLAQVAQQIAQSGIQTFPPLAQEGMGNGQPPSYPPQGEGGMPPNPMPPGKMPPAQFKGHNVW